MGDLGGVSYPADVPVVEEERTWAMAAHLGTMAGSVVPFGHILAPLIIWLMYKDKSPFVDKHARESLVFQIGLSLSLLLLVMVAFLTLGFGLVLAIPAMLFLILADLVYMIVATIRASEGKVWEYPVTSRFVS